jgi:hypothetical protein
MGLQGEEGRVWHDGVAQGEAHHRGICAALGDRLQGALCTCGVHGGCVATPCPGCKGGVESPSHGHEEGIFEWRAAGRGVC